MFAQLDNLNTKLNIFTIDVEEWWNILDVPGEIPFEQWDQQESRLPRNLDKLLELLDKYQVKATLFWLGYFAEKYPKLVKRCVDSGHEIASHGYAHVLAYKVGREKFRADIVKGKKLLEDLTGVPIKGFRAAGFSTTDDTPWVFDEIKAAGYLYDSSVFPSLRGHGGMQTSPLAPYQVETESGALWEFPQSMIELLGKRISLFGGGYFRVAPFPLIQWGIKKLGNRPLIFYIHPREVDPDHPRLQMSQFRRFKSYVNLKSTYSKLDQLLSNYKFTNFSQVISNGR